MRSVAHQPAICTLTRPIRGPGVRGWQGPAYLVQCSCGWAGEQVGIPSNAQMHLLVHLLRAGPQPPEPEDIYNFLEEISTRYFEGSGFTGPAGMWELTRLIGLGGG